MTKELLPDPSVEWSFNCRALALFMVSGSLIGSIASSGYRMPNVQAAIADAPPNDASVTVYDRDHVKLYMRLLDAHESGASLEEVSAVLLGIDADAEPERARRVHDSHLSRARWMTEQGYRDILRHGFPKNSPAL
ncbi:MAG TPA: DUF2285 domain-containing protein [Terrimesophilobacter sp.]|nr:DUF2285 domain-containing protein [Terrimesophilobacter sp.]